MLAKIRTTSIMGIDAEMITVEVDHSEGIGHFAMVGLAENSVKEAKDRVCAALSNSGLRYPNGRLTINLAPADIKKDGSGFDLAIALGILIASGQIFVQQDLSRYGFIGELSLGGQVRSVRGVLPMVIGAKEHGINAIFVPEQNIQEALVVDGIQIYPAKDLTQVIRHLTDAETIYPAVQTTHQATLSSSSTLDFIQVRGQESAKRALEIAAAGGHNLIMIGPPGSGKTMLAKRIISILPELTKQESLEITKIYSVAGLLQENTALITTRPFRSPHHTASLASLTGGGRIPRPGEISLAHLGVLYLDEFAEFPKRTLEILRQPLEDKSINLSRVNASLSYPASFMLLASMNPCPCGYWGDETHECTCTQGMIERYRAKLSGPLLDRIDIQIEVPAVQYTHLTSAPTGESSAVIKKRVDAARKIQAQRYTNDNIFCNAEMSAAHIEKYCALTEKGTALMQRAFSTLHLSARGYHRILKLSRTIADLQGKEHIGIEELSEAIQYRTMADSFLKNR